MDETRPLEEEFELDSRERKKGMYQYKVISRSFHGFSESRKERLPNPGFINFTIFKFEGLCLSIRRLSCSASMSESYYRWKPLGM